MANFLQAGCMRVCVCVLRLKGRYLWRMVFGRAETRPTSDPHVGLSWNDPQNPLHLNQTTQVKCLKQIYGFLFSIFDNGKKNGKNILQINVYDQINTDIFVG